MPAIHKLRPLSVAAYLAMQETSDSRHELVDGYLVAMVGTSQRNNLIAGNVFAVLRTALRGTPCRVFMSDLKVRVGDNFYLPFAHFKSSSENFRWMAKISRSGRLKAYFFNVL